VLVERLSRSRGQGDCPQRTVGLTVGLDDALDDRAADGDDARLVVDVGALERHPFARPQARERGEHRNGSELGESSAAASSSSSRENVWTSTRLGSGFGTSAAATKKDAVERGNPRFHHAR